MLSWTCSVSSASESIPKALETVWALDFPLLLQGSGRSLSCPWQDDPNDPNAGRRDPPCRDSSVPWSRLFPPSPPAFCLRCQGTRPLLRVPWCRCGLCEGSLGTVPRRSQETFWVGWSTVRAGVLFLRWASAVLPGRGCPPACLLCRGRGGRGRRCRPRVPFRRRKGGTGFLWPKPSPLAAAVQGARRAVPVGLGALWEGPTCPCPAGGAVVGASGEKGRAPHLQRQWLLLNAAVC